MVTSTVAPAVHVVGLIAIWASETAGLIDGAAAMAALRAMGRLFSTAMVLAPSRAALDREIWMLYTRLNSMSPSTRRIRIGRMSANSTAAAPRSLRRSWKRIMWMALRVGGGAGGECGGGFRIPGRRRPYSSSVERLELGGDAFEHGVEVGADQGHGRDDDDGDQRDHQAVLDCGGAFLFGAHAVDEGLDLGVELHVGFSVL